MKQNIFRSITVRAGLVAVTAGVLAVAAFANSSRTSAERPAPQLEVRGTTVDADEFSLGALHDRATLDAIEEARVNVFDTCMAERGFEHSPTADPDAGEDAYTLAFEAAAYGPDAWELGPPTVKLPEGTTTSDGVVWQPGSCAFEQDAQFATDPHMREALRYRIMMLEIEANQATVDDSRFAPLLKAWTECNGNGDATALLEALDPADDRPGRIRPGRLAGSPERTCVTAETRSALAEIRGRHHAWAAEDNHEVIEAWVDMIDRQAVAVRGGR